MLGKASRPLAALVFCTAALFAFRGEAQNLPWPDAPKQNAPAAPWPSAAPAARAPAPASTEAAPWPSNSPGGRAPTPAAASPAPMMSMPGAAPMTPVPQAGASGRGSPPCLAEFSKLQAATDKYGKAAREASKRKVPREEMCTRLKSFAGAIGKWANYTAENAANCGIPPEVVEKLKAGASNIAKSRDQVCSAGPAPGRPAAPTLSDALGTTVMPTTESTRPSIATGTLDTLTGVPIGR